MNSLFVLVLMIFCHIVDDYYLQGWLASAKQKEYWEKNAPAELYRCDYIWALIMHSFSWSFMIMLPIAYHFYSFKIDDIFVICLIVNTFVHAIVDHLKANVKCINLWMDQNIHLSQIMITFILFASIG